MRLNLGPPPSSGIVMGSTWIPLREPGPWLMQGLAIPISAIFAGAVVWAWSRYAPVGSFALAHAYAVLGALLLLIAAHETLHVLGHPSFGRTQMSIVGFWPSRLLFYAHYGNCLSRNRLILIFLLPTLVLTLIPLLVAAWLPVRSGWLLFISGVNAVLAGGDILGALLLVTQVPASAKVQNEGYRTYWKASAKT